MTALEFINAFRRFGALRGFPNKIVSDNGTNFVLSRKIIEEAFKGLPENLPKIEWSFITPYSPWKGGFYERMVKSAKHAFTKSVGSKILTLAELSTSFYEIAAAINSRPLTYVESDINSDLPIRPQGFINQEMEVTLPLERTLDATEEYSPSKEAQSNETKLKTIEEFKSSVRRTADTWKIWNTKYLSELREHHKFQMDKKRGSRKLPKVGQVVLIVEENQPRNKWRVARINKLVPSKDQIIREVERRTGEPESILNRSINMIIPLELDEPEIEDTKNSKDTTEVIVQSNPQTAKIPKNRYNLRSRKEINYDDEKASNGFKFSSPLTWSNLNICLMLILTLLSGTYATNPKVMCNPQGIQLQGNISEFESCSENFCTNKFRWSWNRDSGRHIWLPPAIKLHPHHVTTKVTDGTTLKVIETDCPAVEYCSTIDCTFCLQNIINPECHIYYAIFALTVFLFVIMLFIHAMCNVPIKLGDVFLLGWTITKGIFRLIAGTISWICKKMRRIPTKRLKWREIVMIISIIIISSIKACQDVNMITQFENICDTQGKCQKMTEELMHLNQNRREGCIRSGKKGTTLRDIRIEVIQVEMHCKKRSILFTQDVETRIWSTKRCPRMGSCQGTKCTNVTRRSIIPELHEVNQYIGNTGCSESCGGPGCGCFYISSGCIFYRIYALPKSQEEYEIFQCMEYQTMIQLKITVTTLNSWKNRADEITTEVPIGKPTIYKEMEFNVDSIEVPQSPIFNSWFIRIKDEVATWPENTIPSFKCNEKLKNCTFIEDCRCTPAEDQMICTCTDTDIGKVMRQIEKRLPVQAGLFRLEPSTSNTSITAKTKSASSIVSIKISDKWTSTIVKTKENCEATSTEVIGCYSCSKGVSTEITCKSTIENTIASVDCESEIFNVKCTPQGVTTTVTFYNDYAKFQRRCSLDCGGKKPTSFEITGSLIYAGSIWTSFYDIIRGNTTLYDEINIPDITHMAKEYFDYIKAITIALVALAVAFLMTYTVITNTGFKILKMSGSLCWWLIKNLVLQCGQYL